MHGLGILCGLMPDTDTTSQQLNMVVDLISGMPHKEGESMPLKKLKEALSSKQAFKKHFLELSELSMGTYKHIGRIRSARFIGMDLADFYMKLNEPQKAEGFLMDALKTYKQEGWDMLADHTRLKLAACQKSLSSQAKYAKSCLHVAASKVLDIETRNTHFQEAMKIAKDSAEKDEVLFVRTKPCFHIHQIVPSSKVFVVNTECSVDLILTNNLLHPLKLEKVSLSLSHAFLEQSDEAAQRKLGPRSRTSSVSSSQDVDGQSNLSGWVLIPEVLDIETQYEYEGDKSLASTSMVCRTVLRRVDSNTPAQEREIVKKDFSTALRHGEITLNPGKTSVTLSGRVSDPGTMNVCQLCLKMEGLEFLKTVTAAGIQFDIVSEEPSIEIRKPESMLVAGLPQNITLRLNPGTYMFDDSCSLNISASDGLIVSGEGLKDGVLNFSHIVPHEDLTVDLEVLATISTRCKKTFDATLKIEGDWLEDEYCEYLTFIHPMSITHKLQTAADRKFVQVIIQGTTNVDLEVSNHNLYSENAEIEFINLYTREDKLRVSKEQCVCYMWEMKCDFDKPQPIDLIFSLFYQSQGEKQARKADFALTVDRYKTLYMVESLVKSTDSDKICHVGNLCQLEIKVTPFEKEKSEKVLYEIEADSTYWNISGRTTGILNIDGKEQVTLLDLIPLAGGFLPLPSVKLQRYQDQEKIGGGDTENYTVPDLMTFSRGQVYNRSATSQIRVLPASNTSQVDVC